MKRPFAFLSRNREIVVLTFLIFTAAILRFYNVTKLEFFTYDQARDAIFIKRIIVNRQFRLIGTQTSVPGMFLPPFYYYSVAPILWFFRLNPSAIDVYAATIGVLTIPLIFLVANRIFGRPAGLFSAGIAAVTPVLVEITRRAWNPNTLPFFLLIVFYFICRFLKERKAGDLLWSFAFFGYCLSLHFTAWILIPLMVLVWIIYLKQKNKVVLGIIAPMVILLASICPLVIFNFRHHFLLVNQAVGYFFGGQKIGLSLGQLSEFCLASLTALFAVLFSGRTFLSREAPMEFPKKLNDLFSLSKPVSVVAQRVYSFSFQWWGILLSAAVIIVSVFFLLKDLKKKDYGLLVTIVWLFWGLLISGLYSGGFFFFYYLYLFPVPLLLFGFLSTKVWKVKWLRPLWVILGVAIFSFHLYYSRALVGNWRNIDDLREISSIIALNAPQNLDFNIATIRRDSDFFERNSVDYRYFVETFGRRKSLDWFPEDYEKATELFVVDETGSTDVFKTNIMEIEKFNPDKVINQWKTTKGIIVYEISKKR